MKYEAKIIIWESTEIPQELEEQVLEACKNGLIQHTNDLYDMFPEAGLSTSRMDDTEEYILPVENGSCTAELVDEEAKSIWANSEVAKEQEVFPY